MPDLICSLHSVIFKGLKQRLQVYNQQKTVNLSLNQRAELEADLICS